MTWALLAVAIFATLCLGTIADRLGELMLEARRVRLALEAQNQHYGIEATATKEPE